MRRSAMRAAGIWVALVCALSGGAAACGGDDGTATPEDDVEVRAETEVAVEIDAEDDADVAEPETEVTPETEVADGDVADDATDVEETEDAEVEVDTGPASSGFPAHGLVVRILNPGAMGIAEVVGQSAVLSGILFGDARAMAWQAGAQRGVITPATFWQTTPIPLEPGDNVVTITAEDDAGSVSDDIVITYNPAFAFPETLDVRPRVLWVGAESEVVFTMRASRSSAVDWNTMRLLRVTAEGELMSDEGQMLDDGRVSSSGDEIETDGVFTLNAPYTCLEAGPMYFRVSVKVGSPSYTAVSSTVRVDCLERVTPTQCNAHRSLIESAGLALEGGADLTTIEGSLRADASVAAVGPAEDGGRALWVVFDDGLLGAVVAPEVGVRGSPGAAALAVAGQAASGAATLLLASKRALVLSPRATAFGDSDEGEEVAVALDTLECPRYEVEDGRALEDSAAGIDRFRSAAAFGIVSIASEGEVLFGGLAADEAGARWRHVGPQEVVWTGSPVSCEGLLQTEIACQVTASSPGGGCPVGTRCVVTKGLASDSVTTGQGVCLDETQVDLRLGNALITNGGYAVTPSFFETWRGRGFPSSFVHLGGCRTMWNGTLAASFYAAGARAISGFSGVVDSAWAKERALSLFGSLGQTAVVDGTVAALFTGGEDPAHAGTHWRLFGAGNLDLLAAGLLNGDFETGGLTGWRGSGDARAVTQFGDVDPVSGKGMGLVSSGLGFSVETGRLEQTFCIPEDRSELRVSWKFLSEEFKEWCGNAKFQDRFRAELVDSLGTVTKIVEVTVDDLCAYEDGVCADCAAPEACDPECATADGCYWSTEAQVCEGVFNCQCGREFVGLATSSIAFDQGGVYEVMWRRATLDVRELAGRGPVTLRVSVADSGDSLFDTAVLLDAIEVR